jgi:hypothetical protein
MAFICSAEGGIRTPTPFPGLAPEAEQNGGQPQPTSVKTGSAFLSNSRSGSFEVASQGIRCTNVVRRTPLADEGRLQMSLVRILASNVRPWLGGTPTGPH